jgi:hypothetical protein
VDRERVSLPRSSLVIGDAAAADARIEAGHIPPLPASIAARKTQQTKVSIDMLSFSDEEFALITELGSTLSHAMRSGFLQLVANRIEGYPPQARGPGLVPPYRG